MLLCRFQSTHHCQEILGGVGVKVMHCRADAPRSNPTRAILNFFSLKIEEDLEFYEQKFHVRKVKCLVRTTERKMSVWRTQTSDDRFSHQFSKLFAHYYLGA